MKIAKIILSFLFALLIISACDDSWLDEKPSDRLSEANFYQTEEHAIRAITACYDPLKHARSFSVNHYFYFETFSDRALHEQANLNNLIINPSQDRIEGMYIKHYKGVYRCNLAIEKIAGLKGNPGIDMDENLKSRLIGEAKYLRAFYYFHLTKIFRYPPLVVETEENLDIQLTNATQEELFSQMETDLTDAIERLPASYDNANLGRATKGAAHHLLGKVFLYQHKFTQARDQFKAVKDLGVYEVIMPQGTDSVDYTFAFQCNFTADDLVTPSGNVYRAENNKESVFEIQFSTGGWHIWEGGFQSDGHLRTIYFGPEGWRNMVPTAEYVDQFEYAPEDHPAGLTYDPRRYVTIYAPGDSIHYVQDKKPPRKWINGIHTNIAISQGYGWGKHFKPTFWDETFNLHNDNNNMRIFRYTESLLLLAEAEYLVNNGSTPLAVECVNEVRARAGLTPVVEVSPEVIMHEKDVEFGYEIKRYFDLIRWSKYPDPWINITDYIPLFDPVRAGYLPIPVSEINLSRGSLQQNPGY